MGGNGIGSRWVYGALALFLIILSVYCLGDWWDLKTNDSWPWGILLMVRILGAIFLSLFLTSTTFWIRTLERGCQLVFGFWLLFLSALLLISWPGFLMTDSNAALNFCFIYPTHLWFGYFIPFLNLTVLQLVPHVAAMVFFQLILAAIIFTYCTQTLSNLSPKKMPACVFSLFVIFSPAIIFNLLLLSRDTIFSLLILWVCAFIINLHKFRKISINQYCVAGFISGLIVVIRGDGWLVFLPLFLVIIFVSRKILTVLIFGLFASTVIALFGFVLPSLNGDHRSDFSYLVVNTINPVGYVLMNKNFTDTKGSLTLISKVLDVEKITREQTPFETPAFWSGGVMKEEATELQRQAYGSAVGTLLGENLGIYFAGRMETFLAAAGFNQIGFRYSDEKVRIDRQSGWAPPSWIVNMNLNSYRPFPRTFDYFNGLLIKSTKYNALDLSGSAIFWNFIPWLGLILSLILLYPYIPAVSLACIVLVVRVPLIFLAAPASQFKYYFSISLCGPFLLCVGIVLLLKFSSNKKKTSIEYPDGVE